MNTHVTERIQAEFKGLCLGCCRGDCFFFLFPKKPKDPIYSGNQEKPGVSWKCLL